MNEKKLKDYYRQASSLYLKVLEDILEKQKQNNLRVYESLTEECFHKALIAASIDTLFFINNSSYIRFEALLKLCDIQAFDFWKVISSFISSDSQIPHPVKKHFYDLELKIILSLVWKKDSTVHQIVKSVLGHSKEGLSFKDAHIQRSSKLEITQSHEVLLFNFY